MVDVLLHQTTIQLQLSLIVTSMVETAYVLNVLTDITTLMVIASLSAICVTLGTEWADVRPVIPVILLLDQTVFLVVQTTSLNTPTHPTVLKLVKVGFVFCAIMAIMLSMENARESTICATPGIPIPVPAQVALINISSLEITVF
jgi:hypothetical protein